MLPFSVSFLFLLSLILTVGGELAEKEKKGKNTGRQKGEDGKEEILII